MAEWATLEQLRSNARSCHRCVLAETRTTVVLDDGADDADLVVIGEGPGAHEDAAGVPFVGRGGQLLTRLIREATGLERHQWYRCNIVNCRPPNNRDPRPTERAACRKFLDAQLELVDPKVIVTVGNTATRALLATTAGITELHGKVVVVAGRHVVPTFHPAAALRGGARVEDMLRADLVIAGSLIGTSPHG